MKDAEVGGIQLGLIGLIEKIVMLIFYIIFIDPRMFIFPCVLFRIV